MSSALDIQIVSPPNLAKIENFLKDASYRETIEFSANFNTRLSLERRLRLPFFDPQTRVAQSHSQLFVSKRQRMPGFRQGQIYTYPAARWRKSHRQYLNKMYRFPERPFQSLRSKEHEVLLGATSNASPSLHLSAAPYHESELNGSMLDESSSLGAHGPGGGDTSDSNSQHHQQQQSQTPAQQQQHHHHHLKDEWFYDDLDLNDADSLEDPKSPADDEYDYDPRYGSKKRRKRRATSKKSSFGMLDSVGGGGSGRRRSGASGRGRPSTTTPLETTPSSSSSFAMDAMDSSSCGPIGDLLSTPTSSGGAGRRARGSGVGRGRRRTKANSDLLANEPPSFESAAAAVAPGTEDPHDDLRNYRKYI